jgi:YD repeat-containing protein
VDVVDQNGLPLRHGSADQALANFQLLRAGGVARITNRVGNRQLVAHRIEQVHREGMKLRQARDQLGNLVKELRQIEHRRHFAPQREERGQEIRRACRLGRSRRIAHAVLV